MLDTTTQNTIADNAAEAIKMKTLSKALLQLVYDNNWFNIWVPKIYGGLELSLADGCRLLEELAYEDGGLGWTVTLCSGANMFAGFIAPSDAARIFTQREVCWGGSGMVAGRAERMGDHYFLSGVWKYATGAPHLTHFTLNAWVYEHGEPVLDADGQPLYHSFYVDRDDVLIHYDWDTFGLEVTASHSFSIASLKVEASRAFDLVPSKRTSEAPVYHYPFATFAECTLVVNYIGMFRRYITLLEEHIVKKSANIEWYARTGKSQISDCDRVSQQLEIMRKRIYELINETWNNDASIEAQKEEISTLSRSIAQLIVMEAARLFPYAGITGAQSDSLLNRAFRNLFTASQHAMLNV